jgi:hypothetical protein
MALLACAASTAGAQTNPVPPAAQQHHHDMSSGQPLFEARDASGTSWLPDETPMFGIQKKAGAWDVMFHWNVFGQFLYEPGYIHRTGGFETHQASSVNWFMAMGRRRVGAGRVGLRAMLSAEPWTVANCGFINLLANGETCEGDTIHDRQHPHDLFMELSADYDRPIRGTLRWQVYAGLSGEPALGPAGFPHRLSAMSNPIAPITHHWLDSTHITFGLVTTGLYDRTWKAEISVFNGREPDEHRADLDLGPLDSVSGRLTYLPTSRWALQASAGHLHEVEAEFLPQPRSSIDRFTASATYHRARGASFWATTVAYGVNSGPEVYPGGVAELVTHAGLAESRWSFGGRHDVFGRFELVGKPGHDLHIHEAPVTIFTLTKMQAGYTFGVASWKGLVVGAGGTASISVVPAALETRYEGRIAPGFGVFVSVRPPRHAGP